LRTKILRFAEIVTLVVGLALTGFYGLARWDGYRSSRAAIRQFEAKATAHPAAEVAGFKRALPLPEAAKTDFSLWSRARAIAYRRSLAENPGPAIAILRIPKLRLTMPVFAGTSELALNRGAGWIPGTAPPGQAGNTGIAGHRDGFFRGLKDVGRGDAVTLTASDGTETYVVDRIKIVGPKDVAVLRPGTGDSLTLVTCYPFYYVGSAPKRYVVEASLQREAPSRHQLSIPLGSNVKQGDARK
jgi:sortase A